MKDFFKLKEHGTTVPREFVAGTTTFFTMAYIIFVNPLILSATGMPFGAVFLATIFASVIGTLVMGLFANVPYAQAPGMGLNAFFTYTVCFGLGFSWQEALAIVFICGIINILITITNIRKQIIIAIPKSLQYAIAGGIGIFITYIGFKNAQWLTFTSNPGSYVALDSGTILSDSSIIPAITDFATQGPLIAAFGLILTIVLLLVKAKGAILIGIVGTTLLAIITGFVDLSSASLSLSGVKSSFQDLGVTFGAAFSVGMVSLFADPLRIPLVLLAIFAFSLSDIFDTIGTLIGTGRKSGIFSDKDMETFKTSTGFKTKLEKALFADSIATSVGAIFGTSNTTTFVESAAGIEAGGRTGLTSVVTAVIFLLCIFIAPFAGLVPGVATAPALIVVGIMMISSFKDIDWTSFEEAVPAFFTAILMAYCYNISMGIAFGFIFYALVKICTGKIKDIHPIIWGSVALFLIYFVLMALTSAGIVG